MARFSHIRNSFLAGELSPKVWGRTDFQQFQHGCKQLKNWIVLPQGGVRRRQGTQYFANTSGSVKARLIPFVYSATQSYIVELTDGAMKVIDTATLNSYTPLGWVGAPAYADVTYFAEADLYDVQYTQSADVLFLVHPDYKPLQLVRLSGTNFRIQTFDYSTEALARNESIYAYRDSDASGTLTPSHTTAGVGRTVTANTGLFYPGHVNTTWKITHGSTTGSFRITSLDLTSEVGGTGVYTKVNVEITRTFGATTASSDWEEPAWSDYRGWPRTIAFHENRLVYGGNASQPDTLWMSQAYDYWELMARKLAQDATPADDSDPLTFTLASQQVNELQWLTSGENLSVGTLGAEYILKPIDETRGIAPANISAKPQTTHGSSYIQAKRVANTTVFVARDGGKIREIAYDLNEDAFIAEDISILADHLPGKSYGEFAPIVHIDYQESERVIWCLDEQGGLFGITRDRRLGVMGAHHHELGGTIENPTSGEVIPAMVRSLAIVPSPDGTHDDVWMCVARDIDGDTVHYIEVMRKDFPGRDLISWSESDGKAPVYVDSARAYYNGSGGTAWNVGHLFGEVVHYFVDGIFQAPLTLSASNITTSSANRVVAGLPYTPVLEPLFPEAGAVTGSAQMAIKNIDTVMLRFYRTISCRVENAEGRGETIDFAPSDLAGDEPIPYYTGDKEVDFHGDNETGGTVIVTSTQPFPATLCCIVLRGVTNEF